MFQANFILIAFAVFLALPSLSQSCDEVVGKIKSGEKAIVIELKTEGKPSRFVTEDDGILALSLVAAYCHGSIPREKVEIDDSQIKCAKTTQENEKVPYSERIQFDYNTAGFENRTKAIDLLLEKCSIEAVKLWTDAREKIDSMPLGCVQKVRGIVKKGIARHAEFLVEQTPQVASKYQLVNDEVRAALIKQKAEHDYFQELADLFSEAPVKTSLFKKWIDRLEPFVSEHSYSIIDMSKDKIELNNQEDLTSILFMAGAKLPFLPKMMCGGTVSAELMDELNLAIWQPVTTKKGISQRALKNQKTIPETHLVK